MSYSQPHHPRTDSDRGGDDLSAATWQHHEHISAQLELDALRLLADAGTPELAKFAIDSVEEQQRDRARTEFAQALGFETYSDLLEASAGIATHDDKLWFVTPLGDGKWLGWNYLDVQASVTHPTRETAIRYIIQSSTSGS